MQGLLSHARIAARSLLRRPAFTTTAVLTLALGVAASTTMLSVLHGVVLRPLPYPEPDRVVRLFPTARETQRTPWTGADFVDFAEQASAYETVAGFQYVEYSLPHDSLPRLVAGVSVTPGFFRVFGVPALHGRVFDPAAEVPGGARVVVLGNAIWRTKFAADEGIVGRVIDLDGQAFTVVGVMPPGFEYPESAELWVASRFRVPEASDKPDDPSGNRNDKYFNVVARLRPDISRAQARREGQAIVARLASSYPETNRNQGFDLAPLQEVVTASVRPMLLALFGAAFLVLLVACANVAGLLLARAAGRTHEMAVRASLGAGRRQIARQLLSESLLLGLVGGVIGIAWTAGGLSVLMGLVARELPRAAEVTVSVPVLVFALAVSLLSGTLFGTVPLLWLLRTDPAAALREGGSRTVVGGARSGLRALLVSAEMAVSLTLLVSVALLARTLFVLGAVDPGFSERNALTAKLWLPGGAAATDDELRTFHSAVLDRVRALPGVVSAGAVLSLPVEGSITARTTYSVEGRVGERGDQEVAGLQLASPAYFASLGVPVLRGRDFTEADGPGGPPVMIVSKAFADRFFPGQDPIGRRIGDGHPEDEGFQWSTIVGVVGSTRHFGLGDEPRVEAYKPLAQSPSPWISLVLRTSVPPSSLVEPLRRAVAEVSATQPVERVLTMDEILHESLARDRLHALLLGVFAGLALLLAAIGLYGLMSFSVASRSREIGIRIAVGAGPGRIARLVLRDAGRLLAFGLFVGGAAALLVGRLMRAFLHGVPAADPPSFVAAALVLSVAALLAALAPARRAMRADPIASLRRE